MAAPITCRSYARAGVLGNPSDGYNGKTVSVIVRNFFAEVTLYEWERIELLLSQEDHSRFDSVLDVVHDVQLHGYYGGIPRLPLVPVSPAVRLELEAAFDGIKG